MLQFTLCHVNAKRWYSLWNYDTENHIEKQAVITQKKKQTVIALNFFFVGDTTLIITQNYYYYFFFFWRSRTPKSHWKCFNRIKKNINNNKNKNKNRNTKNQCYSFCFVPRIFIVSFVMVIYIFNILQEKPFCAQIFSDVFVVVVVVVVVFFCLLH